MKQSLILTLTLITFSVYSQTNKAITTTENLNNISRYNIDYELKNYSFIDGDSSILNELDLNPMIELRLMNEDLEKNLENGQIIIIYSVLKSIDRNSNKEDLEFFNKDQN